MKYVGGYRDYLALTEDERALDDVLIAMAGEADAHRIADMKARSRAGRKR
jgi:hypothetical protein